jgi:hypothetical protein
MKDQQQRMISVLRFFCIVGAAGWGISALGLFMPWSFLAGQLRNLGAQNVSDDVMIQYWLRMTAGAFTFIGILFVLLALNPVRYSLLILPLGIFMLIEGGILATFGVSLHTSITFVADAGFCLLIGLALLIVNFKSKTLQ